MKYYMCIRATFLILATLIAAAPCAAETKTPKALVGRWTVMKSLDRGKPQAADEMRVDIEFTSSQLEMRMYLRSEERPREPTHVYDCDFTSKNGLLMLDMKTAENNPGPETGIHICTIYKIDGDTLTICSGHTEDPKSVGVRPTKFVSSPETQSDLNVLKRQNPN